MIGKISDIFTSKLQSKHNTVKETIFTNHKRHCKDLLDNYLSPRSVNTHSIVTWAPQLQPKYTRPSLYDTPTLGKYYKTPMEDYTVNHHHD